MTTEKFIEKAKEVHKNKYDYSFAEYVNCNTKIKIICKEHGVFEQIYYSHLNGNGCPLCAGVKKMTKDNFIEKAKKIHGDKYLYCYVDYKNNKSKIKIICKNHGEFIQTPSEHLIGKGCFKCGVEHISNLKTKTFENFLLQSKNIHGNRYDYSNVNYINRRAAVEIICEKHGSFFQTPKNHLKGSGCIFCKSSKGELAIIDYLNSKNIKYDYQKTFKDCKYKKNLIFDFYIPNINLLIEYDGKQHFEPEVFFGGKDNFLENKKRDKIKDEYAKNNDIKLLRIPYTKFHQIKKILKNEIKI